MANCHCKGFLRSCHAVAGNVRRLGEAAASINFLWKRNAKIIPFFFFKGYCRCFAKPLVACQPLSLSVFVKISLLIGFITYFNIFHFLLWPKENETKEKSLRKQTHPYSLLRTAFSQQGTAIAVVFCLLTHAKLSESLSMGRLPNFLGVTLSGDCLWDCLSDFCVSLFRRLSVGLSVGFCVSLCLWDYLWGCLSNFCVTLSEDCLWDCLLDFCVSLFWAVGSFIVVA